MKIIIYIVISILIISAGCTSLDESIIIKADDAGLDNSSSSPNLEAAEMENIRRYVLKNLPVIYKEELEMQIGVIDNFKVLSVGYIIKPHEHKDYPTGVVCANCLAISKDKEIPIFAYISTKEFLIAGVVKNNYNIFRVDFNNKQWDMGISGIQPR